MKGNTVAEEFFKIILDFSFKIGNDKNTRLFYILDLIVMNYKEAITWHDVGGQLGNSDHCGIRYKLKWD